MSREPKRIPLEPSTDLLHILEDVHADKVPRLIEREGEPLAVVVSPEDFAPEEIALWLNLPVERVHELLFRDGLT